MDLSILLLAAGSSSRMGRSKQLLLVDGEPLLVKTSRIALASKAHKTCIVLGHQAKEIQVTLSDLPVTVFINRHWEKGMGNSLKYGLQKILQSWPETSAILILVCDQPLLTTHHLNDLIEHYRSTGKPIITSCYNEVQGVPALFNQTIFPELLSLNDHQGAKHVLEKNADRVVSIPFTDGAIDLDTPEDYDTFTARTQQ